MKPYILGIESSCDDTSAAVLCENRIVSNVIASQAVHAAYGGVVPELASRAHQQNIIPVVDMALKQAGIDKKDLSAVAFTRGPGLLGSLLVGVSFAKAFALGLKIPLIEVDHLQAHILSHFIQNEEGTRTLPQFPLLCLTVSGGHTQIVLLRDFFDMEILGKTIDDAAGETLDKAAKILGLPYPGGPVIDKLAKTGNPHALHFAEAHLPGYDFSFSGLKTSFLYTLQKLVQTDADFVAHNLNDICASIQEAVVHSLTSKLERAARDLHIKNIAVAGGVSANSALRNRLTELANKHRWTLHLPELRFTTDNAAMIAIVGYQKYLSGNFASQSDIAYTRQKNQ